MEYLRNLPLGHPKELSRLIHIRPGRVVSMELSRKEDCRISLLSFADGEGVSEEAYYGDTLYYVLEGEMPFVEGEKKTVVKQGECICAPAHTLHAIGGASPFKLLQITIG
ncbi:MAG: cupin domain-containing protein [Eubacteriales bacterium]|nr:cupin domain-containing protein [Eubacteriales bacterium]